MRSQTYAVFTVKEDASRDDAPPLCRVDRVDGDNPMWPWCCQRLRRSSLHRVLSDPASTLGGCRQGSSHRTRARPADQLTSGRSGGTNMATLQDKCR